MQRFPVAITGLGVICAAGSTVPELWDSVKAGRTAIRPVASDAFAGGSGSLTGVFAGQVDDRALAARIDALGLDGLLAHDRVTQLSVVAAREALQAAGLDPDRYEARYGVVMGRCSGDSRKGDLPYMWLHAPCEQVAHDLRFDGPRIMISTACAAGTNAVGTARDKLWTGEADVVLAGGADCLSASTLAGFQGMQALSDGPCAPYSRSDGLSLGEGAAFLVLEPLDAALERGAPVLAEVLGYGLSADAYHPTAPDPTGRGAVAAVRRALREAGVDPPAVSYVNGHGTGTPSNDMMERKAMRSLFGDDVAGVPISSTKSFVGHTLGAAGAIEAVVCVLALVDDVVPPTANVPEGAVTELDCVPNVARPTAVSVALSNSYAFGGNNASIVLSKPSSPRPRTAAGRRVVLTGIGVIGAPGVGLDAWRNAIEAGRSGIAPIRTIDTDGLPCTHAGEMPGLDARQWAPRSDWRRMDSITRQSLAATRLALDDAHFAVDRRARDELGVILGTSFGPAQTSLGFAQDHRTDISVRSFSQVTFNAPAGVVCKALGVRGPTTTIATGALSGTHALAAGVELVSLGKADAVVVVATDELFPEWLINRAKLDQVAPGEPSAPYDCSRVGVTLGSAAVALLIEDIDAAEARGADTYAEILSVRHGSDPFDRLGFNPSGGPWAEVIRAALSRADVRPDHVGYCASWACGHPQDDAELAAIEAALAASTLVGAPKSLTGDCASASGLVNVVAAGLALTLGALAPSVGLSNPCRGDIARHVTSPRSSRVSHGVALDADFGAGYGVVVLGQAP